MVLFTVLEIFINLLSSLKASSKFTVNLRLLIILLYYYIIYIITILPTWIWDVTYKFHDSLNTWSSGSKKLQLINLYKSIAIIPEDQ